MMFNQKQSLKGIRMHKTNVLIFTISSKHAPKYLMLVTFFWEPYLRIMVRNTDYDIEETGYIYMCTHRDKGKETSGTLLCVETSALPKFFPSYFKSSDRNK